MLIKYILVFVSGFLSYNLPAQGSAITRFSNLDCELISEDLYSDRRVTLQVRQHNKMVIQQREKAAGECFNAINQLKVRVVKFFSACFKCNEDYTFSADIYDDSADSNSVDNSDEF